MSVAHNAMGSAIGGSNHDSDLARCRLRVAPDGQQDLSMIAHECPRGATTFWRSRLHGLTPHAMHYISDKTGLLWIKLAVFPRRDGLQAANHKDRMKREWTFVSYGACAFARCSFIGWGTSYDDAFLTEDVASLCALWPRFSQALPERCGCRSRKRGVGHA